ncbi:hypothetical protein GWI33_008862 [Rhynchophorus ferrugineus]|uniref:Uncharacterized protein n=1 Tax=Rhynchophorus ferrugineus TaxID=354439 RepID=A0A834MBZ0_RHYFE|nr:hypothetical protein GWI33_008862 [Rhynchophorus ferrugineus]
MKQQGTNLFHNPVSPNECNFSLWKMPDSLPITRPVPDNQKGLDCKLADLPECNIGQICIRKSGKTEIRIGSVTYDLECDDLKRISHQVVAGVKREINSSVDITELGSIQQGFNVIPSWEHIVKNLK